MPKGRSPVKGAISREVELEDIRCYALIACAAEAHPLPDRPEEGATSPTIAVRARVARGELGVRMLAEVVTSEVSVTADVGAIYSAEKILTYKPLHIAQFVAHSALPAIYPFLREVIAEGSRRVGGVPYILANFESPELPDDLIEGMAQDLAAMQQSARESTPEAASED